MAKIKIRDLARDEKISKEEMKKVFGGWIAVRPPTYSFPTLYSSRIGPLVAQSDEEEEVQA